MASILFADIAGILAKAQLVATTLQEANLPIPGATSDIIAKANYLLGQFPELQVPDTLQAQLEDLAALATYLKPQLGTLAQASSVTNIVDAISATAAGAANLASGQLAIWATVPGSFQGVADDIVICAFRKNGEFAKLVYQGVSDANDVVTEPPSAVTKKNARK